MGMATAQLVGQDAWSGWTGPGGPRVCAGSRAGAPCTTAALAGRFGPAQLAGIEAAVGVHLTARWLRLLPAQRGADLVLSPP